MRRRRFRKPVVSMSLFPFLAVLVCTMGVLIVLLMSLVQQARVYASHVSEPPAAAKPPDKTPEAEELQQQAEEYRWRKEVLETQRQELTKDLANQRLQLSHLEQHIHRLEQQWKELAHQANSLAAISASQSADAEAVRQKVAEIRAQAERAREDYEAAKAEAARRPRRFAIIPYHGPNGTQRTPIYIECTERGIILQPEGLVLGPDDFAGPLGPGNPLDAALRTTREYLARRGDVERNGEPYPLLVVRPDGAVAYSVARVAMKSWEDEFGYELIEQDIVLDYPPDDPQLRAELERAVRDARERQAALAKAMPSQFLDEGAEGFVATSTRGGFIATGMGDGARAVGFRAAGGSGGFASDSSAGQPLARPAASGGNTATRPGAPRRPGEKEPPAGSNTEESANTSGAAHASLAATRGNNWALPKATAQSTGITRPIYIACLRDQLLILPEKGDKQTPKVVATPGKLADSMDEFVSAIWQHMDCWGIAVANGYWKPTLQVTVGHGAEDRFEELQSVLQGSGIEVQRKER